MRGCAEVFSELPVESVGRADMTLVGQGPIACGKGVRQPLRDAGILGAR